MPSKTTNITERYLDFVEKSINRLPDPFFLFGALALIVIALSFVGEYFNVAAKLPVSGEEIKVVSLLTNKGISRMFTDMVANFMNFPPLGVVLAMVIGIGVADKSGFFRTAIGGISQIVPARYISLMFIFLSVNSSIMADSGVVLMPPLGALIYAGIGRHPIAGLAAGFVGVCGGFSANIFITGLDPLLAGLTEPAAKLIDPNYVVYPTANYYFMAFSVFVITLVISYVTNKIIEPRIKDISFNSSALSLSEGISVPNKIERKAFQRALLALFAFVVVIMLMTLPDNSIFRDDLGNPMPFFRSIIVLLMIAFFIVGTVYGYSAGTIKSGKQLVGMSSDLMNTMGGYIVLSFIIAQFIAYFNWSNLGIVSAIKGAYFLKDFGFTGTPLVIAFLIFSLTINIFIASASAKWAILSTVFVPMFMILGLPPEVSQAVYRVGDSVTNFITPMFPYFPIVIVFAKEISPELSFGKLVSILVPYSIILTIVWGAILVLWIAFGIPMGPGVPTFIEINP